MAAANPTIQWRSRRSPPIVSLKTGISAVWAGDFRDILAKVADLGSLETIQIRQVFPVKCREFAQKLTTILGRVTGWLGREGSNLRMAESKSAALPLGYAPTGRLGTARRRVASRLRGL